MGSKNDRKIGVGLLFVERTTMSDDDTFMSTWTFFLKNKKREKKGPGGGGKEGRGVKKKKERGKGLLRRAYSLILNVIEHQIYVTA